MEVFEGRPNVARLVDWVEREHAGGGDEGGGGVQGGEEGGARRGVGDVEMVIRTQGGEEGEEDEEEDELTLGELEEGEDGSSEDSASVHTNGHGLSVGGGEGGEGRQGMACVACGPISLLDDVESACNARSIDLHREIFEL